MSATSRSFGRISTRPDATSIENEAPVSASVIEVAPLAPRPEHLDDDGSQEHRHDPHGEGVLLDDPPCRLGGPSAALQPQTSRQKRAMLLAVSRLTSGHAIAKISVPCTVPMT